MRRPVELQILRHSTWVVSLRTTASRAGTFQFNVPTTVPGRIAIRAYARRKRALRPIACRALTLVVTSNATPANSFRAVYALASDQTANPNEVAAIVDEIEVTNRWFATQTNNQVQPRWVRTTKADGSAGAPTVITVRLAHTSAEYRAAPDSFALVSQDLVAAAPASAPTEKSVVWIAVGSRNEACGQAEAEANLAVLFEAQCGIYPVRGSRWPGGATYLLAHELTHNLGAVPACAPHYDGTGHVSDDPRDLLYAGPGDRDWNHLKLDPGHDDYYATGRTDCVDIARSTFWTETSIAGS